MRKFSLWHVNKNSFPVFNDYVNFTLFQLTRRRFAFFEFVQKFDEKSSKRALYSKNDKLNYERRKTNEPRPFWVDISRTKKACFAGRIWHGLMFLFDQCLARLAWQSLNKVSGLYKVKIVQLRIIFQPVLNLFNVDFRPTAVAVN